MTPNPTAQTPAVDSAPSGADDAVWRDWLAAARKPGFGALIALTIVGGALRFIALARPPLLYDEAATYTRVCGTFRQMIDTLRDDGFPPLHYEIYWLMGKLTTLTPTVMRLIPALAGTLMIPATYLLARQVASRRVATVAAAMTAFSAYQLVYSRDAKMYMELWLFGTLFLTALLAWLAHPTRLLWLGWCAAAAAANATQALAACYVGVALVLVLTHPRLTRRKLAAAVAGLLLCTVGLAGYELMFNRFVQEVHSSGWHTSGLEWIGQRNRQLSKPMILWDTAASWTLAYRSPRPPITPPTRVITPVAIVSAILIALVIAGAMPWPARLRDDEPDDAPPEAQRRRGVYWIIAWLLLPLIGFYLESFVIAKHDVWNARYLAIVWPPLIVLMAIAFQRLPHPALRGGAIALFIGANLLQFGLRLTVENGAPVNLVASDVAAARRSDGHVHTVIAVSDNPDEPSLGGNGGVFDFPGKYYLALATKKQFAPDQLRSGSAIQLFDLVSDYRSVPPEVTKLIVWQDGRKAAVEKDPVLAALGTGWTRASSAEHAVRDFWCWRSMFHCNRSVYLRSDSGATGAGGAAPSAPAPSSPRKKPKRK